MRSRILVTPLDWGLGHATRCIPVIRTLLEKGCEVHVAGSGDSLWLLRKEFPHLPFHPLPSYNPRYSRGSSMVGTIALQVPHFLRVILAEQRAVRTIVRRERIDAIVSDNRYGCYSADAFSAFMTHQTSIQAPEGYRFLEPWIRRLNERLVRRFDRCWIPDYPGEQSLAGELASRGPGGFHPEVRYTGAISRFSYLQESAEQYDVVALCSGPEPQRTILEEMLLGQLSDSGLRFLLVRGVAAPSAQQREAGTGQVVSFLTAAELQRILPAAGVVIARSGYSTIMDLNVLGKKAVFIPTPGQPEQEYLARRFTERGIALSVRQDEFNVHTALIESRRFSGFSPSPASPLLGLAVEDLLNASA